MENLFWIVTPLSHILWAVAVAFNAAEDTLQYHYSDSVFDLLKKGSWASEYFQSPDNTWRRKYIDPEISGKILERRKFLGITIPAFFFDGWHGFKVLRQLFIFLTFMSCVISGTTWVYYEIYTSNDVILFSWTIIAVSLITFIMITGGIHELFFKHVLMKKSYSKGV